MTISLKILLRTIGDQILVDVEHPAGGQTDALTQFPFNRQQLSVLLRVLEISRSVQETFDLDEWSQLETWQVTAAPFTADANGEMRATENEILGGPLLKLVQEQLYDLLFGAEPARQLLNLALSQVQPREALHLELHLPPGHRAEDLLLNQIPWEVLSDTLPYWPNKRVVISRYVQLPQATIAPQPVDRLRVLVVTARPSGLGTGQSNDAASIATGLRRRLTRHPVQVRELPQATFDTLSDYLYEQDAWHVLHFDGHGDFGRACPGGHLSVSASAERCTECNTLLPTEFSGYLAFEREDGTVDWVSATQFTDLLLDHGFRLVVLNACNSAVGRRGESIFNGLAQSLIRAGVPAVVATPFRLDWEAAVELARFLYQHLGQGEPLVEALDHSRRRLRHQRKMPQEWYRPVLYLRQADDSLGQLFNEPTATNIAPPDPDELRTLHVYAFQPPPPNPPERAFFWQRYFSKNRTAQRLTPDPETWGRELLLELWERKEEIGEAGTIYCPTPMPLSVGLAIGHVFPRVGHFRIGIIQRPPNYWFSDATPDDTSFQPSWREKAVPGSATSDETVLIIYAVKDRNLADLLAQIGDYWQEIEVFSQLAADDPDQALIPSRRFSQIMLLQAEPATRENRFLADWEMADLAFESRSYLDRLAGNANTVHLFLITSVSMATFLGHQWNAGSAVLQLHEWVGGPQKYLPSVRLHLS